MSAPVLLDFEGVSLRLGERDVLRRVSLSLAGGEVVGLVGPNGAGKTTLLRVGSGVVAPDEGGVRLAGRGIHEMRRRDLARQLAVVPQEIAAAFPFTAGELVLMGRAPHLGPLGFDTPADVARAREAMARVGIEHLASRSVLELSGGERQLVLVARALAQEPRVLLLDEPTAHLDLRHRLEVLARVREFATEGRGALVVSHDLGLAARSCDRVALLRDGSVRAVGSPTEVLTSETLRRVFGVEADVLAAPDGAIAVVPRAALPPTDEGSAPVPPAAGGQGPVV